MNRKIISVLVIPFMAAIVTGCAKAPPKCSDEVTFTLIRQIIVEQLGGREGVTDKEIQDNLTIQYPRASAYDEKVKKYQCEGKLLAGGTYELPISYESQLDDNDQHIVAVAGISQLDQIQLQSAIAKGIQEGRQTTKDAAPPK